MNKSYTVEELQFDEEITLESTPRVAPTTRSATYYKQFIDNVALAIVNGDVSEQTVQEQTTNAVFDAVMVAKERFESMSDLYSSRSSLGGVNEYLNPEHFTFSTKINNTTH